MLWTIAVIVILAILWLLGLASSYTRGGFIPLVLLIALVMVLVGTILGRRLTKPLTCRIEARKREVL
jgi:Kef-type K+ transport system membrane component KefB